MNISLTRELEAYVARKVKSGMYQTASEVIREGLRLLREREQTRELRRDIAVGLEQADRGLTEPFDEQTLKEIKRNGRRRLLKSRK